MISLAWFLFVFLVVMLWLVASRGVKAVERGDAAANHALGHFAQVIFLAIIATLFYILLAAVGVLPS